MGMMASRKKSGAAGAGPAVPVSSREVEVRHGEAEVPVVRDVVEETRAVCPKCKSARRWVEHTKPDPDQPGRRMIYARCRCCGNRYQVLVRVS